MSAARSGLLLLALGTGLATPVWAQQAPMDVTIVKGACQTGSTLTDEAGAKPYTCDNAIFAFFDNANSHVMIQFVTKADDNSRLLGFAGTMADDGVTLNVERISLIPGKPQLAQQAFCKLSFTPPPAGSDRTTISGIECKGEVTADAQKTVLSVLFKPDPGQ